MRIEPVASFQDRHIVNPSAASISALLEPARASDGAPQAEVAETSFGRMLRETVSHLGELQAAADRGAERVATGDLAHLHEAVIAMQEASLALDLVIEVRNHLVEGIQELLRTQA